MRAFTAAQMKTAHIYLTPSCLLFRLLFNHSSVWFPCAHTFCLPLSVSVLNQSQRLVVSSLVLVLVNLSLLELPLPFVFIYLFGNDQHFKLACREALSLYIDVRNTLSLN